jgi:ATP-dependent protease ClpP protease subunit
MPSLGERPQWFTLTALTSSPLMMTPKKTGRVGELCLRGYIGETSLGRWDYCEDSYEEGGAGTVKEFESQLNYLGPVDELVIRVSSEGGNYFDALTLADMVKRLGVPTVGIVEGYAFSSAVAFLCKCCDEIRMAKTGWQMIHNPACCESGDYNKMMARARMLEQAAGNYATIIAARGKASVEDVRKMMDEETFLEGLDCVAIGIADVLTDEPALTAFTPISTANFTVEKLPVTLRAAFDNAKRLSSTPPHEITDMKPEEVQALIDKATKPILEASTNLTSELGTLRTGVDVRIEAAVKPVREENERLKLQLEEAEKRRVGGVEASLVPPGSDPVSGTKKPDAMGAVTDEDRIRALKGVKRTQAALEFKASGKLPSWVH